MTVDDPRAETDGSAPPSSPLPSAGEPVSDEEILGLDNVRLELPLAGLGSRGLAVTLDSVVLGVLMLVWFMLSLTISEYSAAPQSWVIAAFLIGAFLLQWSYFFLCELLMHGQTPGKTMVGLRTVGHLGGQPSVGALLVRNLLRPIDYLVGAISMVIDRRYRRIGDRVASTLVIHDREPDFTAEIQLGSAPEGWGAREVAVVESFLRRAPRMDPQTTDRLGRKLLAWVERRDPELASRHPSLPPALPGDEGRSLAEAGDPVGTLHRLFATGHGSTGNA